MKSINIIPIESVAFAENAYLVFEQDSDIAFVVDPGLSPDRILHQINQHKLRLEAILITHGHADHIAGTPALKAVFPDAQVYVGTQDAEKLINATGNLSAAFDFPLTIGAADRLVADGETLEIAGIAVKVLGIPGHSAGHVAYLVESNGKSHIFVGDIIFANGIGRYDFPDGDKNLLVQGIRDKLYTLPDETILYPGHGPNTTIGVEKRTNPFVR